MTLYLSMAAFALASSITPGPVNIVALGAGARHGLRATMRHVGGATIGFTALLLLTGLGLHEMTNQLPQLAAAIRLAGIAFLLYLAWKLATDDGNLAQGDAAAGPSLWSGAAMQWLNPKAWLAALSGMGSYVADGDSLLAGQFAAIYFVVCYLSIACWAWAGATLGSYLREPARIRWFNRGMALLLVASVGWLLANG